MQKLAGKTYYFKANGVRAESIWIKKGGRYYYFDKNGVRAENKWVKRNGKYYYVGENGAIVTKSWVDNNKYYVGANGTRETNTVKDGYYLNASGKNVIKVFNGDYIFVGDSRMVGMQSAVAPSDTLYIAKSGHGRRTAALLSEDESKCEGRAGTRRERPQKCEFLHHLL